MRESGPAMITDELLTAREMRAVEMNSEYLGITKLQLMENAGRAVAEAVMNRFEEKTKVTIVCGLGGNGGDGFVAARHLAGAGYPVEVILVGKPQNIGSGEAEANWGALSEMTHTVTVRKISDSSEVPDLGGKVIVDAIMGTGVRGPLKPPYAQMVAAINDAPGYKIAVDIPTGMDADTGEAHGGAVKADLTLTFHKPKVGLEAVPDHVGELRICPIGIPPEAETTTGPGDVLLATKVRPSDAHKGDFGSLLIIGGSEAYSGAPALAGLGAYAAGVDLVYVAVPESVAPVVAGFSPSLITIKLKGKRLSVKGLDTLRPLFERVDAVAMGPGLGLHEETAEAVMEIVRELEEHGKPVLLDADALKSYPRGRKFSAPAVFTPHSREFEILTGKTPKGGLEEQGMTVRKEATKISATILLKGHVDIISDGARVRYNRTGNPGMTVGGTGDVLSGVAAGFLANGIEPLQAAAAGAFVNGAAGDAAYLEKGYSLEPMDLVERIPEVIMRALSGDLKAYLHGSRAEK